MKKTKRRAFKSVVNNNFIKEQRFEDVIRNY